MLYWVCVIIVGALVAGAEVVALNSRRRAFFSRSVAAAPESPQTASANVRRSPASAAAEATAVRDASHTATPARPGGNGDSSGVGPDRASPPSVEDGAPESSPDSAPQAAPAGATPRRRRSRHHAARDVLHWMSRAPAARPSAAVRHGAAPRSTQSEVAGTPRPGRGLAIDPHVPFAPAHRPPAADSTAPVAEPQLASPPPSAPPAQRVDESVVLIPQVRTTPAEEGIVYVDAAGQLTFANDAARALLGWRTGSLALGDVLAGGSQEATTLLQSVARHELIEQPLTLYAGAATQRLDASALALRDRDGNLWGAALFLRRPQ